MLTTPVRTRINVALWCFQNTYLVHEDQHDEWYTQPARDGEYVSTNCRSFLPEQAPNADDLQGQQLHRFNRVQYPWQHHFTVICELTSMQERDPHVITGKATKPSHR